MAYVYSTLAVDMNYTNEPEIDEKGGIVKNDKITLGSVFIAGKANIPNKHMYTVRGVSTQVTDEQLNVLNSNPVFQKHKQNNFIVVEHNKHDADKVADGMNGMDKSAPDTREKLEAEGKQSPDDKKKGSR